MSWSSSSWTPNEKEVIELKLKFRSTLASVGLMLWLLSASPFHICFQLKARAQQQNAPQPASLKVNTKNIGGAFELTAETLLYGDVKVYLPDDMAAGDTISGTVVAEPKGNSEAERTKNRDALSGYVVEIGDQKVSTSKGAFTWNVSDAPVKLIRIIEVVSGKEVAKAAIPVLNRPPSIVRPPAISPGSFQLPLIGQQGRPVEITGPFDGNFSNTALNWTAQNAEKNAETENDSGGFRFIAESPRKAVFRSPGNFAGLVEVNLKEAAVEAKSLYRNVGVLLTAPKTNLVKGERTTVTAALRGLEGIKQVVFLQLITQGVVTMDGGNSQFILIPPTSVSDAGIFTLTRTLTSQQAGGFSVTAAVFVKPLDTTCLQDEKDGSVFFFNSTTGDYIFMQSGGASGGGSGTMTKKGCAITLTDDSSPDRKVVARIDPCAKSGSATVQTSSPKVKFTIADKNTADNTCAVGK
jgi:hypothetical protein